jgi:hypothetical protein
MVLDPSRLFQSAVGFPKVALALPKCSGKGFLQEIFHCPPVQLLMPYRGYDLGRKKFTQGIQNEQSKIELQQRCSTK